MSGGTQVVVVDKGRVLDILYRMPQVPRVGEQLSITLSDECGDQAGREVTIPVAAVAWAVADLGEGREWMAFVQIAWGKAIEVAIPDLKDYR